MDAPLVNIQKAIENGPFIVELAIQHGDFPCHCVSSPDGHGILMSFVAADISCMGIAEVNPGREKGQQLMDAGRVYFEDGTGFLDDELRGRSGGSIKHN